MVKAMLRSLSHGKDPVHIVQEDGWTLGMVWTRMENLIPTGVQTVVRPDIVSLYTDYIILAANDY
jgi:hypothetical protein